MKYCPTANIIWNTFTSTNNRTLKNSHILMVVQVVIERMGYQRMRKLKFEILINGKIKNREE